LECGLTTVGEAMLNISIHRMNLFVYEQIEDEMLELYFERKKYLLDDDLKIVDALKLVG